MGSLSDLISCLRIMQMAEKSEERNGSEIHFNEKEPKVIHLNSVTIYFVAISITHTSLFICASLCSRQLQNRVTPIANSCLVQVLSVRDVSFIACKFCCFSWNLL